MNISSKKPISSPITGGKTIPERAIPRADIIALYPSYDVSRFFNEASEVSVMRCLDTDYRFYYPYSTAGDGTYYEFLSKGENYYVPWKTEHEFAMRHITDGQRILEIGCANGGFLDEARRKKKIIAEGTELNAKARQEARERGLTVFDDSLSEIIKNRKEYYDVVCSFQVLEHVADVRSFIKDSIALLKPGGYMIIGVPNNESFIRHTRSPFLNMPPHHMGLWNEASLKKAASFFGLKCEAVYFTHLPRYHYRYYYQVMFGDRLGFFNSKGALRIVGKILNKGLYECLGRFIIMPFAKNIRGDTIVGVFQKKLK